MRKKLKNYALVFCLFTFLFIVLGGGLRLNPGAALVAAATGTPLLVYAFNCVALVALQSKDSNSLPDEPEGTAASQGRIENASLYRV
jgi:hypothetical protein